MVVIRDVERLLTNRALRSRSVVRRLASARPAEYVPNEAARRKYKTLAKEWRRLCDVLPANRHRSALIAIIERKFGYHVSCPHTAFIRAAAVELGGGDESG